MKRRIYGIRDIHSGFDPIIDINDECAARSFSYAINNTDTLAFSAKDYDLFYLGDFDTETGSITAANPIQFIKSGISCIGDKE